MRIVGGKYRGKKIIPPLSEGTRPTSDRTREMIFNVLLHNPAFDPSGLLDKAVLDVFAGTGALGLEAFSRGAKSVTFIENNRTALPILRANIKAFELSASCVLEKDAQHLGVAPAPFDLVFLDPPYGQNLVLPTLTQLSSQGWLSPEAIVVIEIGKKEDFPLPSFLSFTTERLSGITKVVFSKYIQI
ncbi:MAG: 16S rRNA (guanine(966)-N(2))-methyltransferase RsmD [Proteobacteria bacterium]|nr:16S rRNA (guanine(966)-N(2))-methyltransferase RsmD [Pseudomonadota bacterium]